MTLASPHEEGQKKAESLPHKPMLAGPSAIVAKRLNERKLEKAEDTQDYYDWQLPLE